MAKYLITGLSGTGKSTLAEELARRGYTVLDTDKTLGLNNWFSLETGKVVKYQPPVGPDWYKQHQYRWDKGEFQKALGDARQKDIFICGSSYNDREFYPLFDIVFFLVLDEKTLTDRLKNRSGEQFGQDPAELKEILKWHGLIDYEQLAKTYHGYNVDATLPAEKAVDKILAEIHDHRTVV